MTSPHALDGLWRIVSCTCCGNASSCCETHYFFKENTCKEFVPNLVDTGNFRITFETDDDTSPKRLTFTLYWNSSEGRPNPNAYVQRMFYEIDGDVLRISHGHGIEWPTRFSDEVKLLTLKRDYGPMPETRKPSGTPPLVDDVLGILPFDDNVNWYSGGVKNEAANIELTLEPDSEGNVTAVADRARQIFTKLNEYRRLVSFLAVEHLLELKNSNWREDGEPEISVEQFSDCLTLDSIHVYQDLCVEFSHFDGGLFRGHSIHIRLNEDDTFVSAGI